eukprot:UN26671
MESEVLKAFQMGLNYFPEDTLELLHNVIKKYVPCTSKTCRLLYPHIYRILRNKKLKKPAFFKCCHIIIGWVGRFRLNSKLKIVQPEPLIQFLDIVEYHRNNPAFQRVFESVLQYVEQKTKRLHSILENRQYKDNEMLFTCKNKKCRRLNFGFREYCKKCMS